MADVTNETGGSAARPAHDEAVAPSTPNQRRRRLAATLSLVAGVTIFGAKLLGWYFSGSTALLSDALESIVNVLASGFAFFAIRFAEKPADRDHPYGHGKVEFLSAAFEGGLVAFAAVLILYTGVRALIVGVELRQMDVGLVLAAGAALGNFVLGRYLLRTGEQTGSMTLVADGHHVLADVWTTAGAFVGLLLARVTGWAWLDPVAALVIGLMLVRTGARLVKQSVDGLLDREDPKLLERLVRAFDAERVPGVSGVHRLRAIRSGDLVHVDAHVFVPAHWSVAKAHEAILDLEERVKTHAGMNGEIALHLDPCNGNECAGCSDVQCLHRRESWAGPEPLDVDGATGPGRDEPGR